MILFGSSLAFIRVMGWPTLIWRSCLTSHNLIILVTFSGQIGHICFVFSLSANPRGQFGVKISRNPNPTQTSIRTSLGVFILHKFIYSTQFQCFDFHFATFIIYFYLRNKRKHKRPSEKKKRPMVLGFQIGGSVFLEVR